MTKSIFYKSPFLYKWGLKFIHRENFYKRYRFLANLVEKGDSVLEPGCGPGILADFLPEYCSYSGFDLNESFIRYAQRKNRSVSLGDVRNLKNYCPTDNVVCIDILHHLIPAERGEIVNNCWKSAKKRLTICEPYRERKPGKLLKWWFEYIERDGTNKPKLEDMWDKDNLKEQMVKGFGIIPEQSPRRITEIGRDLIAIYSKK